MLLPRTFADDVFDDFFDFDDFPFFDNRAERKMEKKLYGRRAKNLMKTDIKEKKDGYELDIDLPGFRKEDVKVTLENGYLTISAQKDEPKEKESKNGRYIRKERFSGACERSFYVGENLTQEDIQPPSARVEEGWVCPATPTSMMCLPPVTKPYALTSTEE